MSRMLDAFQTLASLTACPHRRRALREQVQWIAELAERTVESAHDRARIDRRLAQRARNARSRACFVRRGGEGIVMEQKFHLNLKVGKGKIKKQTSNRGVVVSVRGSVVDIRFDEHLPSDLLGAARGRRADRHRGTGATGCAARARDCVDAHPRSARGMAVETRAGRSGRRWARASRAHVRCVRQQDAAFGIRQIVDVALKALSPGINDVTTAVTCVDYLTVILARLSTRQIPSSHRYEEEELRVIAKGPNFESLLAESFDQIRSSARGNLAIMSRMLDALQTIAGLTAGSCRRQALLEQVEWIAELAERTVESANDRAKINTRLANVRQTLEAGPALCAGEEKAN